MISIFIVNTSSIKSRGSSVGITGYEQHDQGNAVGFLLVARDFSPLQSDQAGCEANQVFFLFNGQRCTCTSHKYYRGMAV